ncbi:transcription initiation factor TFIID subunit 4 [Caerostris extrusa]|uniref:Transcription initiation factor TFIID subunit 4 n=1 Tax=Caerostris extrusa TaxID=172846 RepID=A0AAV4RZK9_CAEEX|nr:transcription initiation factor TFIID subunit 4 [Caerostris extrusa]
MASSFEDLLSSDIDESAVNRLVGSLESELSSSDAQYPRNELSTISINSNQIPNASVADCTARLPDTQKHGALLGSLLEQGSQNTNKTLVNSQIMGLNSVPSSAVIVSLAGALPASGYLNQVSSTQQALLNSTVVNRHVSNADIKLVYSPQSTTSSFASQVTSSVVTSGVITNNINRNNYKVTTLHQNGINAGQQQIATASSSSGPSLTGPQTSGATLSAMQNLANIASQQPRIQVANPAGQQLAQLNALNAKSAPPRNPVDPKSKHNVINNHPTSGPDHQHSPSPTMSNHYQVLSGQAASVITSKSTAVSHLSNPPVNVVTQVVSNSNNILHPGVQIVNVNSTRLGQKTLAPRGLVLGNQVRIAPQVIRQGSPLHPGQNAIALPPGMRSAIVVRADGSQYHVFNVSPPGLQAGAANSPNTTYRLQSISGGVPGIIRTVGHQQVVTVPVSSATVKTLQSGPGTVVRTITPQQMTVTTQAKSQQSTHTVVSTVVQQTTSSITRSTSSATTSSVAMSPNTIKTKCQNFLSTLIRLAGDETSKTASNVKKLIQNPHQRITVEPPTISYTFSKKKPTPCSTSSHKRGNDDRRDPLELLGLFLAPTGRGISGVGGSALAAQLSQPLGGNTILTQRLISPHVPQGLSRPVRPITVVTTIGSSASYSGLIQSSPATVGALQSKIVDEDDINDVAAMGGVNLVEESQRILATNSELIGSQIRSCKDENHFLSSALHRKILQIAKKHGLEEVRSEVVDLVSHAAENRLKTLIEKLSIIAEHRCEHPKNDSRYEVLNDSKAQIKFLEELDKLEKKRHDDQEKEILLKAAKSRSKLEDPELLKLKQKGKRAENEELRQREANMTALLAIGPRKKIKLDPSLTSNDQIGNGESSGSINSVFKVPIRPRVKRANLRDLLFAMEHDPKTVRRSLLYKYYSR